jgi:hypothetical protein
MVFDFLCEHWYGGRSGHRWLIDLMMGRRIWIWRLGMDYLVVWIIVGGEWLVGESIFSTHWSTKSTSSTKSTESFGSISHLYTLILNSGISRIGSLMSVSFGSWLYAETVI